MEKHDKLIILGFLIMALASILFEEYRSKPADRARHAHRVEEAARCFEYARWMYKKTAGQQHGEFVKCVDLGVS